MKIVWQRVQKTMKVVMFLDANWQQVSPPWRA